MTASTQSTDSPSSLGGPRFRTGAGRLCLDYLRTLRHRGTLGVQEELPDGEALLAWVAQCGPCDLAGQPATADPLAVRDARSLREAIHELVTVGRGVDGVAASSILARELVNRAATYPPPTPRVDASGALLWTTSDAVSATL